MARIPQTIQQFERMDFITQLDVKGKLLMDNLDRMCGAISPENLSRFSRVLHKNDLETLKKKKERESSSEVMMDILMTIKRSLRRDPSWWQLLERLLREEENWDLYYVMNPWVDRDMYRGAAGGGGGGGHGGGGGGGGHGRPVLPCALPLDAGGVPYPGCTPLAQTRGLPRSLIPLCADGDSDLWRDLADGLGLNAGDQLDIKNSRPGNDLHRLLMDKIIQRYEDAATVDRLIRALQGLGEAGHDVLRDLEHRGLIHPLQRAGSEADGEVVGGEVVGGAAFDDDRGGASYAGSGHAPTPRVPGCNLTPLIRPPADVCHTNLSCHQPSKVDPQPDLSTFTGKREASAQRPPVCSAEEEAGRQSQSLEAPSCGGRQGSLDRHRTVSTDSILDNNRQSASARAPASALAAEEKILNCPPLPSSANAAVAEHNTTACRKDDGTACREVQGSSSVEADAPSSPRVIEEVCKAIMLSHQEMENQLRASSQDTAPLTPSSSSERPQSVQITVSIKNLNSTNINSAKHVVVGLTDEGTEDKGEEEEQAQEPNSLTGDLTVNSDYDDEPSVEQESGEESEESYRPDPMDTEAHQTCPKQVVDSPDESGHPPECQEPQEDDFDIVHFRPNGPGSLVRDTSLSSCHGETAGYSSHAAEGGPWPSSAAAEDDNLVSEQRPLPPPQSEGVLTKLLKVWGTLLDME